MYLMPPATTATLSPAVPCPRRSLHFLFMCVRCTVAIHNALLDHILRLPKSFFDTHPAGRILNRFSR